MSVSSYQVTEQLNCNRHTCPRTQVGAGTLKYCTAIRRRWGAPQLCAVPSRIFIASRAEVWM